MNYYQARELRSSEGKATGLYHYTRMNDKVIRPDGYCAKDCPGHTSETEAYAHYKDYLLDTARFEFQTIDHPRDCAVDGCQEKCTSMTLTANQQYFKLCHEHANRDGLDLLLVVGPSISSY